MDRDVKEDLERCYAVLRRNEQQDTAAVLTPGMELRIFDHSDEEFKEFLKCLEEVAEPFVFQQNFSNTVSLYVREKSEDSLKEEYKELKESIKLSIVETASC